MWELNLARYGVKSFLESFEYAQTFIIILKIRIPMNFNILKTNIT